VALLGGEGWYGHMKFALMLMTNGMLMKPNRFRMRHKLKNVLILPLPWPNSFLCYPQKFSVVGIKVHNCRWCA
jgi:hypothetical protein